MNADTLLGSGADPFALPYMLGDSYYIFINSFFFSCDKQYFQVLSQNDVLGVFLKSSLYLSFGLQQ